MAFTTFEEALRAGEHGVSLKDVWTLAYFPFTMGGNVWQPVKTTVPVLGPFEIGRGYQAYAALSPKGNVHIVEAETGAFVGTSLEEVRKDIKEGDPKLMEHQVADARLKVAQAHVLEPAAFWKKFKDER